MLQYHITRTYQHLYTVPACTRSSFSVLQAAEVLRSQVSRKLDVFSFGMMMYEIISCEVLPGNGPRWTWLRTHEVRLGAAFLSFGMVHKNPQDVSSRYISKKLTL